MKKKKVLKPILFNPEMVRAILDGRKTETRRVVKPQPNDSFDRNWECFTDDNGEVIVVSRPFWPGDILYVRETWCNANKPGVDPEYYYLADAAICEDYDRNEWKWRPSIHMPKAAARIFLRVTEVRLERLREIDEDGAIAEGLYKGWRLFGRGSLAISARQAFMWLWTYITRKSPAAETWACNPWVWVISFERCENPETGREGEAM